MIERELSETEERLDAAFAAILEAEEAGCSLSGGAIEAENPDLADALSVHRRLTRAAAPMRHFLSTVLQQETDREPALPPGTIIGDYEIIDEIGRGGMGVVYKARHQKFNMLVALKMISAGRHASDEQRRRFLDEVEHQARMNHPHIVPVKGGGEYGDCLYFTMTLIERADGTMSLDQHLEKFRADPRGAARLMIGIARALHHAHQRGILHRDLKPANILLDDEGNPHVADFGLAKQFGFADEPAQSAGRLDSASVAYRSLVGTVPYMSPEQADPDSKREVTTLSDVYGLGATLYALLTGRPPFQEDTVVATLRLVRDPHRTPDRIRPQNPGVDLTLERICLKCLNKDPERRYLSAEGFARDLERWLHGERPSVPQPLRVRCWNWCRRNPGASALVAAMISLLILSIVIANVAAARMEDELKTSALASNTLAAERIADHLRWLLREEGKIVLDAAKRKEVRDLLRTARTFKTRDEVVRFRNSPGGRGSQKKLEELFKDLNEKLGNEGIPAFATVFLQNKDGRLVALAAAKRPDSDEIVGALMENRDYFLAAKANAEHKDDRRRVHVSRVFRSITDELYKFAISVPVLDDDETFLGVIEASIPMDSTLGLQKGSLHGKSQQVALIGRVDRNPASLSREKPRLFTLLDYDSHVLLHEIFDENEMPGLRTSNVPHPGPWPSPVAGRRELDPADRNTLEPTDDYRDPLAVRNQQKYGGRRVAGFARVGNTELIVIVQQRYDDAIGLPVARARMFVWWGWIALALAAVVAGIILWYRRRQELTI